MKPELGQTSGNLRRLLGRGAWLAFLGPLQRNSLALQRSWFSVTHVLFLVQCRLTAALSHASIDVRIDPSARIALGVRVELARSTHNVLEIGARSRVVRGAHFAFRGGTVVVGAECLVRRLATFQASRQVPIRTHILVSAGA